MIPVPPRSLVNGLFSCLQWGTRVVGYFCACYGWFIFVVATVSLILSKEGCGDVFRLAGVYIAPGWLLLRLSAGLFPFGKQMFRQ
jgi:hypothetical protein